MKKRTWMRPVAALLAFGLVAAACGDDATDADTAADTAAAEAAAAAAEAEAAAAEAEAAAAQAEADAAAARAEEAATAAAEAQAALDEAMAAAEGTVDPEVVAELEAALEAAEAEAAAAQAEAEAAAAEAEAAAEAAAAAAEPTETETVAADLSGVCPSPLVVQTDWFPESEHGAMYELVGDDYIVDVDNKVVRGSMVLGGQDLGIEWEVRTGGPAIGFSPVSQHMAVDPGIHLGYASTDQQINHWDVAPLVSVVAPLERNPQMIMWDPETYPDVTGIADLGAQGITINVFGGGTFSEVFVAQGIWSADQVDPSYEGNPSRFVGAGGSIAQQGFASSEVYTYEHVYEEWGKPVAFQLLHDAGFQIYSQTIGVRPGDMEELRPCLERLVPIIQQAAVDFNNDPARANAIIVDAVDKYQDFWVYPPDLAEFSHSAKRQFGLIGDGGDGIVGNMVPERIAKVLDDMRTAGMDIDPDLTADQLFTNEFIDPNIGHGF